MHDQMRLFDACMLVICTWGNANGWLCECVCVDCRWNVVRAAEGCAKESGYGDEGWVGECVCCCLWVVIECMCVCVCIGVLVRLLLYMLLL